MDIPEELNKKSESPNHSVPIVSEPHGIPVQGMSESELGKLVGMIKVPDHVLTTLASVGRDAEGLGVLRIASGSALFTQKELMRAIGKLSEIVNDPKTDSDKRLKASYPLGYLCDKLTKAISTSVEIAEVEPSANPNQGGTAIPRRSKSFGPGIYIDKAQFNMVEKEPQKP